MLPLSLVDEGVSARAVSFMSKPAVGAAEVAAAANAARDATNRSERFIAVVIGGDSEVIDKGIVGGFRLTGSVCAGGGRPTALFGETGAKHQNIGPEAAGVGFLVNFTSHVKDQERSKIIRTRK